MTGRDHSANLIGDGEDYPSPGGRLTKIWLPGESSQEGDACRI
jgi:hypothetical protein